MESGKLFKMPFYVNNTCYIIIIKYYFDGRYTGLVSILKTLIFQIYFLVHKLNYIAVSIK